MPYYFYTACDKKEVIVTHGVNFEVGWTNGANGMAKTRLEDWMENGNFNDADLKDDTYLYAGVACDCNPSGDEVRCAVMYANVFHPRERSNWVPKFFDYTP